MKNETEYRYRDLFLNIFFLFYDNFGFNVNDSTSSTHTKEVTGHHKNDTIVHTKGKEARALRNRSAERPRPRAGRTGREAPPLINIFGMNRTARRRVTRDRTNNRQLLLRCQYKVRFVPARGVASGASVGGGGARGPSASFPGVLVVVGQRHQVHGVVVGRGRRRRRARPGRALLPQQLLVRRRQRLAVLVHQREDALHRRLHVTHAAG